MWRRNLHDKYGYFDERCAIISDALLWEQWKSNDENFGLLDKEYVLYFASSNSLERRIDTITNRWVKDIDLEKIGRMTYVETTEDTSDQTNSDND